MDKRVHVLEKPETKRKLVMAALELFADGGYAAVSMRTINTLAGSRNASAAHYWFGGKFGLLEGVARHIVEDFRTGFAEALAKIEAEAPRMTLRELVHGLFTPMVELYRTPGYGKAAIRFFCRMQLERDPQIQEMLMRVTSEITVACEALLIRALPQLPLDLLRLRLMFAIVNVLHGMSDYDLLKHGPYPELGMAAAEAHFDRLVDYIVAGLGAPH